MDLKIEFFFKSNAYLFTLGCAREMEHFGSVTVYKWKHLSQFVYFQFVSQYISVVGDSFLRLEMIRPGFVSFLAAPFN